MSRKLPFFKFDADAWLLGKIQLMSAAHRGIFINLIARIWRNGGSIKIDDTLARQERVGIATLRAAITAMASLGIIDLKNNIFRVKFVDEQILDRAFYVEKQRDLANRRWGKNAKALPTQCLPNGELNLPNGKHKHKHKQKEDLNTPQPPKGAWGEAEQMSDDVALINFADRLYREYCAFATGYQMAQTKALMVGAARTLMAEGQTIDEATATLSTAVDEYRKLVESLPPERREYKKNSYRFFADELWRNVKSLEGGRENERTPDDELGVDL